MIEGHPVAGTDFTPTDAQISTSLGWGRGWFGRLHLPHGGAPAYFEARFRQCRCRAHSDKGVAIGRGTDVPPTSTWSEEHDGTTGEALRAWRDAESLALLGQLRPVLDVLRDEEDVAVLEASQAADATTT